MAQAFDIDLKPPKKSGSGVGASSSKAKSKSNNGDVEDIEYEEVKSDNEEIIEDIATDLFDNVTDPNDLNKIKDLVKEMTDKAKKSKAA